MSSNLIKSVRPVFCECRKHFAHLKKFRHRKHQSFHLPHHQYHWVDHHFLISNNFNLQSIINTYITYNAGLITILNLQSNTYNTGYLWRQYSTEYSSYRKYNYVHYGLLTLLTIQYSTCITCWTYSYLKYVIRNTYITNSTIVQLQ